MATRPVSRLIETRCTSSAVNVARPARERDQRQIAQRLRAVALVLIEVALLLDDDAARTVRKRAHRDVVGQRAAWA